MLLTHNQGRDGGHNPPATLPPIWSCCFPKLKDSTCRGAYCGVAEWRIWSSRILWNCRGVHCGVVKRCTLKKQRVYCGVANYCGVAEGGLWSSCSLSYYLFLFFVSVFLIFTNLQSAENAFRASWETMVTILKIISWLSIPYA